jgi:hypothetical protein
VVNEHVGLGAVCEPVATAVGKNLAINPDVDRRSAARVPLGGARREVAANDGL